MRRFVLAALLLTAMGTHMPARSEGVDAPPKGWRSMTRDDATTTSKCFAHPTTPLCAVETFFACHTPPECYYSPSTRHYFLLRRAGDIWRMVGWVDAPPKGWRSMTRDATTTSKCFAHPTTPLCAVEAYYACRVRLTRELCDLAEYPDSEPGEMFELVNKEPDLRIDYKVFEELPPSRKPPPMPPGARFNWHGARPGDAMIGISERKCFGLSTHPQASIRPSSGTTFFFGVSETDGAWSTRLRRFNRPRALSEFTDPSLYALIVIASRPHGREPLPEARAILRRVIHVNEERIQHGLLEIGGRMPRRAPTARNS